MISKKELRDKITELSVRMYNLEHSPNKETMDIDSIDTSIVQTPSYYSYVDEFGNFGWKQAKHYHKESVSNVVAVLLKHLGLKVVKTPNNSVVQIEKSEGVRRKMGKKAKPKKNIKKPKATKTFNV